MEKLKLTRRQLSKLERLSLEITRLRNSIVYTNRDFELSFDNGLVSEQLDCASSAFDCILQEFH